MGGLTIIVAALLGFSITRPLRSLVDGTSALAKGEFGQQISVLGRDEFAHLSRVFNQTTINLSSSMRTSGGVNKSFVTSSMRFRRTSGEHRPRGRLTSSTSAYGSSSVWLRKTFWVGTGNPYFIPMIVPGSSPSGEQR